MVDHFKLAVEEGQQLSCLVIRVWSMLVVGALDELSAQTPILALPENFGQTWPFALSEISRYDERGPAWYWNNISTGEHTGTHFDAPIHKPGGPLHDSLNRSAASPGHAHQDS